MSTVLDEYKIEDLLKEMDLEPKVEKGSDSVGDLVSDIVMGRCPGD
jgi:hypothetical protein